MTLIGFMPCPHRAVNGLALALAATVLSGCGGGAGSSEGQAAVVTVTVTPTVTATVAPPPTTATRKAGIAKSDVTGRGFDLGTIVSVVDRDGLPVIVFDRWTVRGVEDAAVADRGVSMGVHSDAPYQNLNSKITYRIPVAEGARFTYRHCVAVGQPLTQKSSTVEDFARLPDKEQVILLTLNQHGQVFSAQNDPAC